MYVSIPEPGINWTTAEYSSYMENLWMSPLAIPSPIFSPKNGLQHLQEGGGWGQEQLVFHPVKLWAASLAAIVPSRETPNMTDVPQLDTEHLQHKGSSCSQDAPGSSSTETGELDAQWPRETKSSSQLWQVQNTPMAGIKLTKVIVWHLMLIFTSVALPWLPDHKQRFILNYTQGFKLCKKKD